ncbi:LamG-like jellyroll fold domain-containing protein [Hymenobacter perfusus]|uniref:T9SS C-terminal target domain-containing protein n=1 Tax=Hymenobacter perfusus TaxID=1236770 RepID=A0A428K7A9_9BACT|nr:LamG-like jellyroll fold domain-containing protein [Hymenobacter perfusus]RSK42378.1 T9SS C-terminal target domain-containing protein [Hymenobacter perfusus]
MKQKILSFLLILVTFGARAQQLTMPVAETFETDSEGNNYTSNSFSSSALEYFQRATVAQGTNYPTFRAVALGNQQGTGFWATEGSRGTPGNPYARSSRYVVLREINTRNYKDLVVKVAFAAPRGGSGCGCAGGNSVTTADRIRIQYSFDGGTFVTAGLLLGDNGNIGSFRQDLSSPLDSIPDAAAPQLDAQFRDITVNIPATGNGLRVRVVVDSRQPELAFDNIRVTGTLDVATKPELKNLGSTTAVSYTERPGTPVQLTNTVVVGYSDNSATTLTGATIKIVNFQAQDRLNFTNQNGISGSYLNGTLTLSSPARTQDDYQTALRSITYSSDNTTTLNGVTRQVEFQVYNGTALSNNPSLNVPITLTLNAPAALNYTESFDSDGEGTRYFGNSFQSASTTTGFFRSMTNPAPGSATTFTGISSGFWYGEGTNTTPNPSTPTSTLQLAPVNADGYSNLRFTIALGSNTGWENSDYFDLYYRANGGSWQKFGSFVGGGTGGAVSGNSVTLSPTLQDVVFNLPAAAAVANLDFKLELRSDAGEDLAFDNIRVTGVRVPTLTTKTPTTVTGSSAVLGGDVTADGGAALTERGVVYSSSNTTPTIGGTGVTQDVNTATTNSFSETIAGLAAGTTYYVRAYATNSAGTGYGNVQTFTTPTTVVSIVRTNPNPNNAAQVNYTVTFASSVTGVNSSNFNLTTTLSGASVGTVSGSGTTYNVVVNTGTGDGTLTLNLANSTGISPGISNTLPFAGEQYSIDKTRPTVAVSSSAGATGSTTTTTPIPFTVTFSENVTGFVAGDVTVTNGTITGNVVNGTSPGTIFTFTVTPTTPGTATTVSVPANVAQDAASNFNTAAPSSFSITYNQPNTTVVSVTRLSPSPTALATVSYRVVFASSVTGVSSSNFTVTGPTGSGVASGGVSGSGTTYTVVVSTGTGNGTLQLNVNNSTGISPTVTNVPYTSGEQYSIVKSFPVAPLLTLRGAGSASGNYGDVTAFVDQVQVLQGGSAFANGLQNGGFETNNVPAGSFLYASSTPPVAAAPWTFGATAGVSRNSIDGFASTAPAGDAVALLQNGTSFAQNLAVPTGSYQVTFLAAQRGNNGPSDQLVNVFLNDGTNNVFVGNIQPTSSSTYQTFTSAAFSVTAPALTTTISSTAPNPTTTVPIPVTVTFSASVTGFDATDVTVSNGVVTTGSFSGSGSTYTFTVTPSTTGAVTVDVAANVAQDANNTGNTAATQFSIQYNQPRTNAPVVLLPSDGSTASTNTPTYNGTAVAGSTVTVYIDGISVNTILASSSGNWATSQPTPLSVGVHQVYARAQRPGELQSFPGNTNTFTVTDPAVYISSTSDQPNVSRVAAGSTNQEILRVAIVAGGGTSPALRATSLSFQTTGSTAPLADIDAARLYYTGTSSTFATTTQFGATATNLSSFFSFTGNQQLATGTNYFFLVYDVNANATIGNQLDATVISLTAGGSARTPSVTAPAGSRQIVQISRVAGTALRTTAGYVSFGASPLPVLGSAYTQMAWIKRTGGTGNTNYYVLGNGTNNTAAPYVYVTGNGRIGAGFGSGGATQPQNTELNSNVIATNEWNHVAATYTGSVLTVYLNGTAITSLTPAVAARTPASTAANFIGSTGPAGTTFPGDIEEVSQWTRALSATEIRQLRHLTLSGSETGLASYLQFNDAGTTTTDIISGAVGTLAGATRVTSTAPVGAGVSNLQSVTGTGNYSFTGTNVAINFTAVAGAPYDVVVARLEGTPLGTQVSDPNLRSTHTRAYWIVNKYNGNSFTANITYTLDPGLISVGDAAAPANLKLYKRGSNADGAFDAPISATAANAAASTVTFPVTSFSQTFIGTYGNSPLPVELVRFTAERKDNDALLQWATAQERNNNYFEVESSVDGRTFRAVGRITGHGTSNQPHEYTLTDANLARYARSVVYYRLRQVDMDGTSSLSAVQTVHVPNVASALTALVFPNPATNQLTVRLSGPYGKAQGWLFDAQGRTVQELSNPLTAAAGSDIHLSVANLPTGVYTLRLVLDGQVIHQQVMVQH